MSAATRTSSERFERAHPALDALPDAPRTPDDLHRYVRGTLGFEIPRQARVEGHDAPFDYLLQTFFEDRQPRDCLVWASRGSGKTQLAAIATLLDLLYKPGIQVCILGGSLDQSMRLYEHLRALLEDERLARLVDGRVSARGVRLVNGSRVRILSQSQCSVRGQRIQKLRCDEVELFDPEVWEAAQMVTRTERLGAVRVRGAIEGLSTMHRPHGLMQKLVRSAGESNRRIFRWNVIDVLRRCEPERPCASCPLFDACGGRAKDGDGFFDIDDAIDQQQRVSDDAWQAEMLCGRPSRSESVYPHFDESVHVQEFEPEPRGTWIGGLDFGFREATVMLWAQVTEDGRLLVLDEMVERLTVADDVIERAAARSWPVPDWIGADPAGHQRSEQTGGTVIQLWQRAGFRIKTNTVSFDAGIGAVQTRLKRADGAVTLTIHPRCRTLIESLALYHYPPKRPEATRPIKDGHDHAADALRYLVTNLDRRGSPAFRRGY